MENNNSFQGTISALFKGMEQFTASKTVVGEAVHVGDAWIIPLADVTFGALASSKKEEKKNNNGGGIGGKVNPTAVLVVQNGMTKLITLKHQDGLTKLMDLVPDVMNRFMPGKESPEVQEVVDQVSKPETF